MKRPSFFLIVFCILTQNLSAQLPALPNNMIEQWEMHVTHYPDLEAYHVHRGIYRDPATDSLMVVLENFPVGHLYAHDTQIWFRKNGMTGPRFTSGLVTGTWQLLYDFSLQPGDTAYMDSDPPNTAVTIDSITTWDEYIWPTNAPLKVFHLSNGDSIIEKIGSVQGFFRPYTTNFEHSSYLCETVGDYMDSVYTYVVFADFSPPCGSSGIDEIGFSSEVYPNPFTTLLTVKSSQAIDRILLYDLQGRQVLSEHAGHTEKVLDVSGLPEAVYTVVIVLKDQTELRRRCVKL